jgi:hypothetical protein
MIRECGLTCRGPRIIVLGECVKLEEDLQGLHIGLQDLHALRRILRPGIVICGTAIPGLGQDILS